MKQWASVLMWSRERNSSRSKKSTDTRGRTRHRQATLDASLQLRSPSERRSATPKRRLSEDSTGSGEETKEKHRKVSSTQSDLRRSGKSSSKTGKNG